MIYDEDELWAKLQTAKNVMIAKQQERCHQLVGTVTASLLAIAAMLILLDVDTGPFGLLIMVAVWVQLGAIWVWRGWPEAPTAASNNVGMTRMPIGARTGPLPHHPAPLPPTSTKCRVGGLRSRLWSYMK